MRFFDISVAAILLTYHYGTLASPIAERSIPQNLIYDEPLGFDPNYQKSSSLDSRDKTITPEILLWPAEQFGNDTSAVAAPSTPSDAQLKDIAKRFIFGSEDNRQVWDMEVYPWSSVGRINWDNGVFCSGALVGPRQVLTARHCLPDAGVTGTFAPAFDDGERLGSSRIILGLATEAGDSASGCETKADWAVLLLDQDLGNKLGYFGVKSPDHTLLNKPMFYHMGYPGDLSSGNRPYRVLDVTMLSDRAFECDATGPFYSDADTAGGQSGGPLWQYGTDEGRWIIGALSIGVSWGQGEGYSGFASGAQMVNAVKKLREQYP